MRNALEVEQEGFFALCLITKTHLNLHWCPTGNVLIRCDDNRVTTWPKAPLSPCLDLYRVGVSISNH